MKKMAGFTKVLTLIAAWALPLGFVSLAPAEAATGLTLNDIYSPAKVLKVELILPNSTVQALNNPATFKVYAPGQVKLTSGSISSPLLDVSIKLKGTTSMSALNATPSFKIRFKKDAAGLGYLGLRRMTLNAMTQDTSKVHEFGAYALFNAMGVPASKTGWAKVLVNGVSKGLYVNIEQPDQIFMSKRFKDVTQHVYEGVAMKDFKIGSDDGSEASGSFLVDYGWKVTPNKSDLSSALYDLNELDPATWYDNLNKYFDRTTIIKTFAVENFLGHWDGYSGPDINNYYVRTSTRNKFTIIPWGTDQTFGENRQTALAGDTFFYPLVSERADQPWANNLKRGLLYVKCINYKPCRTSYLVQLKAVSAMATTMKLGEKMTTAAKVIDSTLVAQYKSNPSFLSVIHKEQTRSLRFITTQQANVKSVLSTYGVK
jgi:hypothetical protein